MPDMTKLRKIFCEKLKRLFYHDVLDSLQMNSIVTAFDKSVAESSPLAEPPDGRRDEYDAAAQSWESELVSGMCNCDECKAEKVEDKIKLAAHFRAACGKVK